MSETSENNLLELIVESDAELVRRVRQGHAEAFGSLSRRYEKSALAAALADTRDIHLAEDVLQEALLLAFRRIETLRDDAKFGPWLMTIVRRRVVETVRARKVLVGVPLENLEHEGRLDAGVESWIDSERLLNLIARLPERERVLIGLRYFDGHNVADLAAITARPVGTVTKQLSRAVARLRSLYGRENPR